MAYGVQVFRVMADDDSKSWFQMKDEFIRAFNRMLEENPERAVIEGIAVLGRAQQTFADNRARDERYESLRLIG